MRPLLALALALANLPTALQAQTLVKDLRPGSGAQNGSDPADFVAFAGKCFFTADDGLTGRELWSSDGTAAGTVQVLDLWPGTQGSLPTNLVVAAGKLWFAADDGSAGRELWCSDGTSAGTRLVRDVDPGSGSSQPAHLTEFAGKVFFSASEAASGRELWCSDGTANGTRLVHEFDPGPGSGLTAAARFAAFHPLAGRLLVAATVPGLGTEWWSTDGTSAGTALVVDFVPGPLSGIASVSVADSAVTSGSRLYWYAATPANGSEVGFTDGTASGTGFVEIFPGSGGSAPFPLFGWKGLCFAQATNGISGYELWVVDADTPGAKLVRDLHPGAGSSLPRGFVAAGERFFFVAGDATPGVGTGDELYVSDGTPGGTTLVLDLRPGPENGIASDTLRALGVGTRVLCVGDEGSSGAEYYVSDGSVQGTLRLADLWPGVGSGAGATLPFAFVAGRGFVRGDDGTTGRELHAFTAKELGAAELARFGAACALTGLPTIGSAGGPPVLGNAGFRVTLEQSAVAAPAALFFNNVRADLVLGACTIHPSLTPTIQLSTATGALGSAAIGLPLPSGPWNLGIELYFQWVVLEAGGPLLFLGSTSDALRLRTGAS